MKKRFVVAMVLTALVGCGGNGNGAADAGGNCAPPAGGSTLSKAYCQKAKECCSKLGETTCEEISSTEAMNDCVEFEDEFDSMLACDQSDVCQKARTANSALLTCMSQISCSDINTSTLVVGKCQAQARAACNALKAAGNKCQLETGFDIDCSAFDATFDL